MYTYNEPSPLMPPAATGIGAFGESAGSPVDTEATDIHHGQNNSDDPNDASLMSDDVVVSIRKRSPSLLAVTAQEIDSLFSEQAPLLEHSMFKDGRPPIGLLKGGATTLNSNGMGMRDSLAGASDLASSVQSHHGGGNNANVLSNNPSMYSATSEAFQNQNRAGVAATTTMMSGGASGGGCPQSEAIQAALNDIDVSRRDTSPAATTNITTYATALQPFNQLYHHHRKHKKASVFHFDPSPAPLPFPSLAPLLYSTIDSTIEEIQRCIETLDRVPLWDSQKMPHSELTSTLQHVRSLRAGWRESMEKKLGVLWLHVSDRYGIYSNRMDVALRRRHLLEVEAAFSLKGAGGGAGLNSPNGNDSTSGGGGESSGRIVSHVRAIPVDTAHLSGATPLERSIIIHLASLGVRWPGRGHDTSALVPVSYFSQEYDHDVSDGVSGGGKGGGLAMTTSSAVVNDGGGRISLSRKGGGGGGGILSTGGGGVDRRRSESTMLEDALSKGMGGNSGDSLSGGGGGIVMSMSTGGVSVNSNTISNGNNNNNNMGGGGGNVSAAAAVELPPGYLRLTSGKIAAVGDITAYGDINESLAHDARIKQKKVEEERRRQRAGLPPATAEPAYNPRSAILREAMGLPPLQTSPSHNPSKRRFQTNDAAMALLASGSIRTPAMFKAAPPPVTSSTLLVSNNNGTAHHSSQQQQQQQQPFSSTAPATSSSSSTSTEPLFQKLHLLAVKQLRERNLFNKTTQNHFEQLTAAKGNDTSLLGAKMAVAEDVLESVCEVVERKVSAALLLARTSDQHASSSHTTPMPNFLQRHASNMERNNNNNNTRHRSSNGGNHVLSPTRGGGNGNGTAGSPGGQQQAINRRGNTATNSAVVASSSQHHPHHAPTKPISSTTVTPKDIPLSNNRRSVGGGGQEEPLGTMINNNTPPRTAPGGARPGGPPRGGDQPTSSMPRPL